MENIMKNNLSIKISIITVVYNGEEDIEETIKSVINQTYKNIKYIIVDGKSSDNTMEIIDRYRDKISVIVSEPDKGLYDAMNKGLDNVSGEYVIFMNCGDTFVDSSVLEKIASFLFEQSELPNFIYGDAIEVNNYSNYCYLKKARNHKFVWYGMFTHHQAMLYNIETIKNNKIQYDLSYKIGADYAFTASFLKVSSIVSYIQLSICKFKQDGLSSKNWWIGIKELWKVRKKILGYNPIVNFSVFSFQYIMIILRKRIPQFYNILRFRKM